MFDDIMFDDLPPFWGLLVFLGIAVPFMACYILFEDMTTKLTADSTVEEISDWCKAQLNNRKNLPADIAGQCHAIINEIATAQNEDYVTFKKLTQKTKG